MYVLKDGRRLDGSPLEIVEQMRAFAFGHESDSIAEYSAFVAELARRFEGAELRVAGEGDDQIAASLLAELERVRLVRAIPAAWGRALDAVQRMTPEQVLQSSIESGIHKPDGTLAPEYGGDEHDLDPKEDADMIAVLRQAGAL